MDNRYVIEGPATMVVTSRANDAFADLMTALNVTAPQSREEVEAWKKKPSAVTDWRHGTSLPATDAPLFAFAAIEKFDFGVAVQSIKQSILRSSIKSGVVLYIKYRDTELEGRHSVQVVEVTVFNDMLVVNTGVYRFHYSYHDDAPAPFSVITDAVKQTIQAAAADRVQHMMSGRL